MMFHYFIQDQSGTLRIGYIASQDKEAAETMLQQAHIQQLLGLTEVAEDIIPKGARYMYPFAGLWHGKHMQGTVEGETVLSALEHLNEIFDGAIEYIAERAPANAEERKRFAAQTTAILSTFTPKPKAQETASAVATVLDRQFQELLHEIQENTKELLRERQFAEEVQEMHRNLFAAEHEETDLKTKYDTLSYTLRELSYIEDGLDPSPVKKDMRGLVEKVVSLLKKVEKSMVRTAFHMDNRRIREENMTEEEQGTQATVDHAISRYASRRLLVAEVMESIRTTEESSVAFATADTPVKKVAEPHHSGEHSHAAEPLSHMLLRELPLLLEWFAGFSLAIIITGQLMVAMDTPLIFGDYNLAELLQPFAWQHTFLKTTLVAILILAGLRARQLWNRSALLQWLSTVVLLIAGVLAIFAL